MTYDLPTLVQFLVSGLSDGCVYGLIGIGFSVIFNASGIINFSQGAFVMLGGMFSYALFFRVGLPLILAVPLAAILVAFVGFAIEFSVIRPLWLRRAPLFVLIIATLIIQVAIEHATLLAFDSDPHSYPAFSSGPPATVLGTSIARQNFWIIGCSLIIVGALWLLYRRTILGKAMRACAVNRQFAELMGIPVERILAISFSLSAFLGAVGGALITPLQYTSYNASLAFTVNGFIAAVIGGLGNATGAFVGGLFFGVLEAAVLAFFASGYKDILVFGFLLAILIAKPSGFFGSLVEEN